jgi:MFS family permease
LVIPAGFLVDHYGPRQLFVIGSVLATATTAGLGLAETPAALAILMGLSGLLHALRMTALNASFFANLKTIGIARAGWFKGSMAIGLAFIGPLLSGLLIDFMSMTSIFYLLAGLTLLPIGLALVFLQNHAQTADNQQSRPAIVEQLAQFRALLALRTLYLPLLTECLSTALFATFSAFVAVIAIQRLGLPPASASLLLGVEGALYIVTLFAGWPLFQSLGVRGVYGVSTIVILASLFLLTISHSISGLAAAAIGLGLGLGLTNLIVSDRIGHVDAEKGKVVGLFSAFIGVGLAIGPLIGGAVGTTFGTSAIFLSFVPLFLLLGLAGLRVVTVAQHPPADGLR